MIFVSRTRPEILADAKGTVISKVTIVEKPPLFAKVVKSKRFDLFHFFAPNCENELKSVNFSENVAFRARARRGLLNQWNINGFGAPWGRKCTFGVQSRIFAKKSLFCGIYAFLRISNFGAKSALLGPRPLHPRPRPPRPRPCCPGPYRTNGISTFLAIHGSQKC